jgi:hypothetical protein
MVRRRSFGSLDKFLKLASEYVVHLELSGDFFCDVQAMRAASIDIHLLQDENVCVCIRQEIDDSPQL